MLDAKGYTLMKNAFPEADVDAIRYELLQMGNVLSFPEVFEDVDALWNHHKMNDRGKASAIYNGFKYLSSIKRLAVSEDIHRHLRDVCGIRFPALVDINCRIDSWGEGKYLFDWHQDYWFSVCSPNAVVVWLPIVPLSAETGGLQIIGNDYTGGRILKAKIGDHYRSYADAVVLDEQIPDAPIFIVDDMSPGDALFFRFNTLHKSIPIQSKQSSRFTVQLRYADYCDPGFIDARYRPGSVTSAGVDYIKKEEK